MTARFPSLLKTVAFAAIAVSAVVAPAAAFDPKSTHVVIVIDDSRADSMSARNRAAKRLLNAAASVFADKGFTVSIEPVFDAGTRIAQPSKSVRDYVTGLKAAKTVVVTLDLGLTVNKSAAPNATTMTTRYALNMNILDGATAKFLGKDDSSGALADIAGACAKDAHCLLEETGSGMLPIVSARASAMADRLIAMK
ncbi:MAG TPA: hypothetical protein PK264_13070 [Hyphomicrobiaceae bacterium]|nr:hypothetical protein [Hyphomicrobiaceae bacterium]